MLLTLQIKLWFIVPKPGFCYLLFIQILERPLVMIQILDGASSTSRLGNMTNTQTYTLYSLLNLTR